MGIKRGKSQSPRQGPGASSAVGARPGELGTGSEETARRVRGLSQLSVTGEQARKLQGTQWGHQGLVGELGIYSVGDERPLSVYYC